MSKKFFGLVLGVALLLGGWQLASAQTFDLHALLNSLTAQVLTSVGSAKAGGVVTASTDLVPAGLGACPGGATMPRGTTGQTIYCNGTAWVAVSNLWNDGRHVRLTNLTGTGGAYLCLDSDGTIFRSATNCSSSQTNPRADIYTSINANSPPTRTVTTSANTLTTDVVLGVFNIKSRNIAATLNTLNFNINRSNNAALASLLSNVRLIVGNQTYGANSLAGNVANFTNLTVNLPQDQWVELTLKSDVLTGVSGVTVSAQMIASSIMGVDANSNALNTSNATNTQSNDTTFQLPQAGALIVTTIDSASPPPRIVTTNSSQVTSNVVLGNFAVKSQSLNSTLNGLQFGFMNSSNQQLNSQLQNVRLIDNTNGATYGASSINVNTVSFTNIALFLPANQWHSFILAADVLPGVNNVTLTPTLQASTITGIDQNFNNVNVSSATNVTANYTSFRLP